MPDRRLLGLILGGYLLLTLAYSVVNPLFEAPDEHWHYFTAQFIKDNRTLPVVTTDYDPWLAQEAAQPPLYYLLGAALIAPVETDAAREQVWLNPFFYAGDAAVLANINQVIHTDQEQFPWQGVWLAAHLLRLFSTLLGLGTLLCIYGSARLLWPAADRPPDGRVPLLATALIAFLPQFNFVHASISNDALIIFLCAFALWQLLWLWQHEDTWPRLLLLGVTCGLAALTKNAGILLLAYVVGVLFLRALRSGPRPWQSRVWRWGWRTAVFVLWPAVALAGWLWWRNFTLYGDVTATEPFIRIADGDRGYTLGQVLAESGGLVRSLFAVFGWFNLLAPAWVYAVWGGIVAVALAGILKAAFAHRDGLRRWRQSSPDLLDHPGFTAVWLLLWVVLVYAGLVAFMLRTPAAQGRLLFPALLPLALGLTYGLTRWRWRGVFWLPPLLALLTSVYACFFVIRPAYARPATMTVLPPDALPLNLALGDGVTLAAVTPGTVTAVPGDTLWFDFYWTADPAPAEAPELVVELFGRDLALLGQYHSYHGQGQYPANLWPADRLIADRVGIRLPLTVTTPVLAPVYVHLIGTEPAAEGVAVVAVKIVPADWPAVPDTAVAQIGQGITVAAVDVGPTAVQPGQTITVDVTWRVDAPPGQSLTTLLHLAQPGQPPLATGDNQPLTGQYPTTVWAAGEVIQDQYTLTIPPDLPHGRYPLWLGMYETATISRLPLAVDGVRQPNDMLRIGEVVVGE